MAEVDERRRSKLYEHCRQTWDEETAETLMAYLPSAGWADMATKQDVAAVKQDVAAVKHDVAALGRELRAEMAGLGGELRAEMAVLRADLVGRIDVGLADVRGEIQVLRAEMHELFSSQTWRVNGVLLAGMGLAAAIARYG